MIIDGRYDSKLLGSSMKKYSILFKTSAVLSYLFLFFGLSWTTRFWRNYWEFSSWVGNVIWIRNIISLLFIGLMIWIWLGRVMLISFVSLGKSG